MHLGLMLRQGAVGAAIALQGALPALARAQPADAPGGASSAFVWFTAGGAALLLAVLVVLLGTRSRARGRRPRQGAGLP